MLGSLFRSVAHALLSTGRFAAGVELVRPRRTSAAASQPRTDDALLSVYGTLFLTGTVAASRADDRASATTFLREADESASRLGRDANEMWTAFGPTNVAIHRMTTAMELGDVQVAVDLAPRIDTSALPTERRVRHAIETARAYTARNRRDDALTVLLDAEQLAPEQIRHHGSVASSCSAGSGTPAGRAAWRSSSWPAACTSPEPGVLRSVGVSDPSETFATPRVAAGALFFDDAGRVLLVHPTYKDTWDIPGGYVERGESPAAACRRELQEELGLDRQAAPPARRRLGTERGRGRQAAVPLRLRRARTRRRSHHARSAKSWTAGRGSSSPSSTTTSSSGSRSGSGPRSMGTARGTWSTVYRRRDQQ